MSDVLIRGLDKARSIQNSKLELPLTNEHELDNPKFFRYMGDNLKDFLAYKGASITFFSPASTVVAAAIWGALSNEFQGGCKFPYISEVSRGGFGWLLFLIGCVMGSVAWIFFANHFYALWNQHRMNVSAGSKNEKSSPFWNKAMYCSNLLGIVGLFGTGVFDMGYFPLSHEIFVFAFVFGLLFVQIINFVYNMKYLRSSFTVPFLSYKVFLFLVFFIGVSLFVFLGMIDSCKSEVMTIEECLKVTSESICLRYQSPSDSAFTVLRIYKHCSVLHFWRGASEFLTTLAGVEYVRTMEYDRDCMLSQVIKATNAFPQNQFLVRSQCERDEEIRSLYSPDLVQSYEKDTKLNMYVFDGSLPGANVSYSMNSSEDELSLLLLD